VSFCYNVKSKVIKEKNMAKGAYFGLPWLVSVILAIVPVTNLFLGIVTRLMRGNILGAVLNFFLCPIFYVIDIITVIFSNDLTVLA
jgi:hypothetical protein